ncbi:MAG: hypothetical protein GY874_21110 [Desulfobacteraceae bacterium]|nr:hypothetical protein [Desulfobacteraceae bacterium]
MIESNQIKIFTNDVTNIDCALLLPEIGPRGQSWKVDIEWAGKVNDDNNVILDFSYAKKLAKKILEQYDHKIITRKSSVIKISDIKFLVAENITTSSGPSLFAMNTFEDTIVVLEDSMVTEKEIKKNLEILLADSILELCPENIVSLKVKLNDYSNKNTYWSYNHILKNHQGNCQKFHGHSGMLSIFTKGKLDYDLTSKVLKIINNSFFVSESYKTAPENSNLYKDLSDYFPQLKNIHDTVLIEYRGTKGPVAIIAPNSILNWLPVESTIENIAYHIKKTLNLSDCTKIQISEGINKGVIM